MVLDHQCQTEASDTVSIDWQRLRGRIVGGFPRQTGKGGTCPRADLQGEVGHAAVLCSSASFPPNRSLEAEQ